MQKLIVIILSLNIAISALQSQNIIGQWQTHYSYERMQQVVNAKGKAFVVADGHLFSYNSEDEHVQIYTKINGLNDSKIKKIAYNKTADCLVIIYESANIDILLANDKVVNIPNLSLSYSNIDKTINDIYMYESLAYVSTGFGFFTINLSKNEIKETAVFNFSINSICILNNEIYAASAQGVYKNSLNGNLQDFHQWQLFPLATNNGHGGNADFADKEIKSIFIYKDRLHFFIPNTGVYYLGSDNTLYTNMLWQGLVGIVSVNNDNYIGYKSTAILLPTALDSYQSFPFSDLTSVDYMGNNQYWITTLKDYLSLAQISTKQHKNLKNNIKPVGPLNNYAFFMTFEHNKLLTTGGGYFSDRYNTPAQLSEYKTESGWYNFDKAQIDAVSGENARDFASVISHPDDENHLFVTSWGEGLYEFKDGNCIKLHNTQNSTLEDIFGGSHYIRIDGLAFDKNGNLWTTNSFVTNALKILKKDGTWAQIYSPELSKIENLRSVLVDANNVKWITVGNLKQGILLIDENNTFDTTSDDKYKFLGSFVNQQGNSISFRFIHSLVEDKNGNIWLATDTGPYVIYNSKDVFSKNIVFNQVAIPRNDGTNYIDYLLNQVDVTNIVVDGANRKWISTSSAGVYLVSADGVETIHHFTADNSPLPSNAVRSLAMDEMNGIIYIGTENGILSYKSDAQTGAENFNSVSAYPNPVRADFDGVIIITGLMNNTTVKITDINGNILKQGKSLGGQFTWDGKNSQGIRVTTGVYLVFGSVENGSQGVVSKIMIVK